MADAANSVFRFGGEIQWWDLAAGIGLFLFGLHLVQEALEGGYSLPALGSSAAAHVKALMGLA